MNNDGPEFKGTFRVEKKFHLRDRIAQPGERITLDDAFLARDLIELRRVTCDEKTAAALRAVCTCAEAEFDGGDWVPPPPGISRRPPTVHLLPRVGVARRR